MIRLLYKPTGNIFTLPDEEALRIKNDDRGNDYVVVEAGLQKKESKTISEEETKQIEASIAAKKEIEANENKKKEEKLEAKLKKEQKKAEYVNDADALRKMSKDELVIIAEKLGIRDMDNKTIDEIIDYITGNKKKNLKQPGKGRTRNIK